MSSMSEYPYTKESVNMTALRMDIRDSSITAVLSHMSWDAPDSLLISFETDLTSGEETTLNGIVSSHTGQAPSHYRLRCTSCFKVTSSNYTATPTKCPLCESTSITDIEEQVGASLGESPDGTEREIFVNNDSTMVVTQKVDR